MVEKTIRPKWYSGIRWCFTGNMRYWIWIRWRTGYWNIHEKRNAPKILLPKDPKKLLPIGFISRWSLLRWRIIWPGWTVFRAFILFLTARFIHSGYRIIWLTTKICPTNNVGLLRLFSYWPVMWICLNRWMPFVLHWQALPTWLPMDGRWPDKRLFFSRNIRWQRSGLISLRSRLKFMVCFIPVRKSAPMSLREDVG